MNLPPSLLAFSSLFWGWQTDQLWLGVALALVLEAGQIGRWHGELSERLLLRISNGCALGFIAMSAYFVASLDIAQAVLAIVRWTPVALLPLCLAVRYGGTNQIGLAAVSGLARRRKRAKQAAGQPNGAPDTSLPGLADSQVDLGVPYVALWLLAAGSSNHSGPGFYLGLVFLSAILLWRVRPPERPLWPWLALMLVAAGSGALINQGLYHLQGALEQTMMDWIAGDGDEDPQRTETELGHIGQLKLSGHVVLQVHTEQALASGLLLKTASYNHYAAPNWLASGGTAFSPLLRNAGANGDWPLTGENGASGSTKSSQSSGQAGRTLEIATRAGRAKTVLALPHASLGLSGEKLLRIERNPLGTVQATLETGFYRYQVSYLPANDLPGQFTPQDLALPRQEAALLQALVQQLHLSGQSGPHILASVKGYFARNFRYSTARGGTAPGRTAVADFLQRDKRGHCEHFATASVLLLRAAGLPARYTVGYLVQEPNRFGSGYVVRARHAHAWVEVYLDGAWQAFDSTPPGWPSLEQKQAASWEVLQDLLVALIYRVRQWHFSLNDALWLGLGVLIFIWLRPKWRARKGAGKGQRATGARQRAGVAQQQAQEAHEMAFYQIEAWLAERGLARPVSEPLTVWQMRIGKELDSAAAGALAQLVQLHYRCRFGPQPGNEALRAQLRSACAEWLARFGGEKAGMARPS
jgi:hypothetical protein